MYLIQDDKRPHFIEHIFLFKKFNCVIKDGKYNFKFKQMNFWCSSHRICLCILNKLISGVYESQNCPYISNKQIFSARATELDFVFYHKTVKNISKNVKNQLIYFKFFFFVIVSLFVCLCIFFTNDKVYFLRKFNLVRTEICLSHNGLFQKKNRRGKGGGWLRIQNFQEY